MRLNIPFYIPVIVLALSGVTFSSCHRSEPITEQAPVRVGVVVPRIVSDSDARTYSGIVESDQKSAVSFSVPGTISHIYVAEGQRVAKGQLLARVESGSLVNANNIAQATLAEARDAYERLKKLHDADALPEIKWVEVQSKLKQASNAAEIGAREVSDAALYSPVSGVVSKKLAEVGQNVMAGIPVFTIVGVDDIKMSIHVSEGEIDRINEGDPVSVGLSVIDGETLDGKVIQKAVEADPLTRGYAVKVSVTKDTRILPGMTGTVKIVYGGAGVSDSLAIVLPSQSVLLDWNNRNFVWIVRNGKAERKYVTVSGIGDDGIYVSGGVYSGDSVIVSGMPKVSTGTPVEPILNNM